MIEYASNLSIKNIKALRKAIKRIIKVALNPDMPIQASFKACKHVLDFSMGKSIRADEHIEPIGIELSKMDLEEVLRNLKFSTDGIISSIKKDNTGLAHAITTKEVKWRFSLYG